MKKFSIARLTFCSAAVAAIMAGACGVVRADPVQWTTAEGGNNQFYERVDQTGLTFQAAETQAAGMTFDGLQGHLAIFDTADYAAERDFVFTNVYSPGVTSEEMYWLGAFLPNGSSTWSWVDGSTVPSSISNEWDVDHAEGPGDEGGGFFQATGANSDDVWDYIASDSTNASAGFIVEFDAVPEPASLTLLAAGSGMLMLRRKRR